MNLPRGLYEQLITLGLQDQLASLDQRVLRTTKIHPAEAPNRIALHLSRQIECVLSSLPEQERVTTAIQIAEELMRVLGSVKDCSDLHSERLSPAGAVLRGITHLLPDGSAAEIAAPMIPLLDTTLLTNSPGEPRLMHQLEAEIHSAQRIDLVMAFIRMTGVQPLLKSLQAFTQRGGELRVLTTIYTGSTQRIALDQLVGIGAQIKVSYDRSTTRLHAKSWLFERGSGFSTAYIGSSNLTYSAQLSGLEWNVRVSGARNPDVIGKIRAVFDAYWESGDFKPYDPDEFSQFLPSQPEARMQISPLSVELRPFQERLLEELAVARSQGQHRNLLVAATGTGKTVMAAVDYARGRKGMARHRLLFVAHREEILRQSQATFRHVLRDPGFGELWTGGYRPDSFDHVFASVQSLHAERLRTLEPDRFDWVIIDEFHHAAAPTYQALLDHLKPSELLGLTATPERSDGQSVLSWFGGRVAADLRLWDAINQQLLSPFHYFGIHDGMDLRRIPWKRGTGYDTAPSAVPQRAMTSRLVRTCSFS
jgi:HKD family nuclease